MLVRAYKENHSYTSKQNKTNYIYNDYSNI